MNDLNDLLQRVDKIEPWLKKTVWPPMTYMAIPSVLKEASEVIAALQSPTFQNESEPVKLLARITVLRENFKRDA